MINSIKSSREKNRIVKKQFVCIACKNKEFSDYGDLLMKCQNCGLTVAKQIPNFAELAKLYKKDYFFGMEYSNYKADRPALEKNFRNRISFLEPYIKHNSKVVEIGSAYGYFLNLIKEDIAWHKGFDVSKEGTKYAKNKLHVNASSDDFLKDHEIKSNSIDLICMWDVIEHLGEPDKHIEKAAKLLKKNGALSLTTGDISALIPRIRGTKWRIIHPPTHIYYFTPESIKNLLAQYSLEVVRIRYKSTYRNTGSVFNQLLCNREALSKSTSFLDLCYKASKSIKLDKLNIPLNLYDIMEVTAIKSS